MLGHELFDCPLHKLKYYGMTGAGPMSQLSKENPHLNFIGFQHPLMLKTHLLKPNT